MNVHQKDEWHDFVSAYDYTSNLGQDRWAWEWLRRIPAFREAAYANCHGAVSEKVACHGIKLKKMRAAQPGAEAFGLTYFPNPDLDALSADVIWSRDTHPRPITIEVVACAPGTIDMILQRTIHKCEVVHFLDAHNHQHLLIKGAGCVLQLRVEGLSLLDTEPREMKILLPEWDNLDLNFSLMKQAKRVYSDNDTNAPIWSAKVLQYRNALICIDARTAGLSAYQMAEIIYGSDHVAKEKERGGRALRDAMRRFLAKGDEMLAGAYKELLHPKP